MEKKYFTIQEVARHFGVASSLIRFWEKAFSGILQPSKNSKGARRYQEKDIVQLRYIYMLVKEKGYSLAGARKVIQKHSSAPTITPAAVVQRLHALRSFLVALKKDI
ncbi:MAG: MerR family transcriptional regulator [Candidatus Cardinium sp.]|uniref:MerR family transcriptional regulator n=1 Tax=Cardinium endosymbiont of Dermatophagoides farinae TaxID=2597823 RepID=UPI00118285F7|nr:MerR family transcriptional regulator [Cardinium endosymbiont of Dermatophagoides farinae]TSJ81178.1 MerR family transcriptional regulator [Cardinium endosymbiont of Dermatophagoides farinae]UWW97224.1 MAG: MerR family transcriptional regulator [Candidatus Cardinium sp.]